jgi:hypothetical protein
VRKILYVITLLVFLQKLDYLGTASGDLEEFDPNEIANDAEDVAETRREIICNGWKIPTAED